MSAFKGLKLPPPTSELKAVTPYLQRAEEVLKQEPIVAYWCAYYAAQLGISTKAKSADSRNLLIELLGLLERLKRDIGSVDAMEIEAASVAYVENFALKVFSVADNEDRHGTSTRGTAKKFLAAAHFLEVLKVFGQSEMSELIREKIIYAKWKASEIAKAFREGRKPTPGPAGSELENGSLDVQVDSEPPVAPTILTSSATNTAYLSPPTDSAQVQQAPPLLYTHSSGTNTAAWSTAATPGTSTPYPSDVSPGVTPAINSQSKLETPANISTEITHPIAFPPGFVPTSASAPPMPKDLSPPTPTISAPARANTHAPQPFELTPLITAKAQKHARFAISALDYDDIATARRELRNALTLLGE